ncbi:MAG: hypothetical protein AMJ95_03930 [Omnitrophica WOR_2 bacterium SM23_72]|nr:MAG: hypothetical protein AMJ95_03930 [Omnitrophica WOR_2 bacterium SM23_72]
MREHLGFLKASSAVVKIAAWIFLFLGIFASIYFFSGKVTGKSPVEAVVNLLLAVFFFFLFYIIAKIADLLVKIIHEIHELKN